LNDMLKERCRTRQAERAGRHEQTIGKALADREAFRDLPAAQAAGWVWAFSDEKASPCKGT
jgi:hypothetical protein